MSGEQERAMATGTVSEVSLPRTPMLSVQKPDFHTVNCAAYFNACLKEIGVALRETSEEPAPSPGSPRGPLDPGEADALESLREGIASNVLVTTAKVRWLPGCVYPGFSTNGRPYVVKVSCGAFLEASLLQEAKTLLETKSEDVFLPVLVSQFYHHMSSTHLLVMDYCMHSSLEDFKTLIGQPPVPPPFMAKIVCGVSRALHFLHTQGIFHGAINERNILVTNDLQGRVCGLSAAKTVQKGEEFENTYTDVYKAPESELTKTDALPFDMFAVGVVLYACFFGSHPKRKDDSRIVDFDGVLSSAPVTLSKEIWRTLQLLLTEKLVIRLSAGQLMYTEWIERAKFRPIKQLLLWNRK